MENKIKLRVWDKDCKLMHICGGNSHDSIEIMDNKVSYYNLQNGCGSMFDDAIYILMQNTGLVDVSGEEIYEGDIVEFLNKKYTVVYECGCFGLASNKCIDYDHIRNSMDKSLGNTFSGCFNDNFISLWEIYWNFNHEEDVMPDIEIIGNIYENSDLLQTA